MLPPASPEVEITIKTLSKTDYSYRKIINEVRGQGLSASYCLISKVLNTEGKKRQAVAAGLPAPPIRQPLPVLTPSVLR